MRLAQYEGSQPSDDLQVSWQEVGPGVFRKLLGCQVLKGGIRNDNLIERTFSPGLTLIVIVKLACLNPFNPNSDQSKILNA